MKEVVHAITQGKAGFQIGASRNLSANNNDVTLASGQHGIGISGGDLNTVNCNDISGSGDKGIYGLMAGRSAFVCNTTLNTNLGLHFDGVFIGKGTIPVAGNTMSNNASGGLLMGADAVIGEQVHRGNKWTGGVTLAEHQGGILYQKSRFFVDQVESGDFMPTFASPPGWFTNHPNSTSSYQCIPGASCPSIFAASDLDTDKKVAKGDLNGFAHQAAQLWLAQRRLHERLYEEGNPYPNDPDITAFLQAAQSNGLKGYSDLQTGIRQLFNLSAGDLSDLSSYETLIEQYQSQLAQTELSINAYGISQVDSLFYAGQRLSLLQSLANVTTNRENKLATIWAAKTTTAGTLITQNNALIGSAAHLANEKTVNQILLQTLAAGTPVFSPVQISTLESVAEQCPLEGGEAVLRARDLLALTQIPTVFDDAGNCNPLPRESGNRFLYEGGVVELFPNPADDKVTIRYELKADQEPFLRFCNLYGQQIKMLKLPGNVGEIILPLNEFETGVYLFSLNGRNAGKLIVNH